MIFGYVPFPIFFFYLPVYGTMLPGKNIRTFGVLAVKDARLSVSSKAEKVKITKIQHNYIS